MIPRFIKPLFAVVMVVSSINAWAQLSAVSSSDTTATRISHEDLEKKQVSNPLEAISGRVAGLSVQNSGNGLAAMNAVRVRGTTSLTGGNDPLIIIDGVFGNLSTLAGLYLADIESFTVLKDASQTAQYGARGASGVIEVTTKRGSTKRASVTYNGSVGFAVVSKNLKMLDADGYRRELSERGLMLIDKGYNTNWQKQIERTAFRQDHHVAFTGGGENSGYRVAIGYMNHEGVILHDALRNFTSNMSMHQNIFDGKLKVDVGMFGNILKERTAVYDVQKTFYSAATWNPTFPTTRNAAGNWDGFTYANQINHPLALMDSRTDDKTSHLSTHAKLTFTPGKEWNISLFGAYTYSDVETSQYLPTSIWAHGQAYRSTRKNETLLGNIVATWDKTMSVHHINVMGMIEGQRELYKGFNTTTTNFTDDRLGYDAIQAGALSLWEGTSSYRETPTMASVMARVTYDLLNRYKLTVAARGDGSSRFGDNNKWGFFPSMSAVWTVSNEPFARSLSWLNSLKLRASVGLAGNQGGIDSYMSLNTLTPGGIAPVGEEASVSLTSLKNVNPDLKWEVKRTINAGVDIEVLQSRLFASFEFYTSRTSDMLYLYNVSVPPFKYNKLLDNLGSMRNSGVEISIGGTPVLTRDLVLNINANAAFQSNKLLSLSGYMGDYYLEVPSHVDIASLNGAGFHGGNNHIVYQVIGQPLGMFYLPHCTGLVSDGNGGYVYEIADLNGDGVGEASGDRQLCGQAMPKLLLGTNFSVRYKNCDLTIQANGAFGHKIYNGTALTYMNMNSLPGYNVLSEAPSRNIKDQTATDYWLERGDYMNIDYITVGWNVPLRSNAVSRLRLSATVNNVATITGYSGLTPMINSSNVSSTLGVDDKNIYPVSRTFTLSASITF